MFFNTPKPDIVCITETWLDSSVVNSTLGIPDDYVVLRHDRPGSRRGGGVLIAALQGLNPILIDPDNIIGTNGNHRIELLWASISFGSDTWLVGALYRPPSSSVSFWNDLQSELMLFIWTCLMDAC